MRKYPPAVLIVGVVLGMLVAPAGANYIETWSDDEDLEGWYAALEDPNFSLTHDDTADALRWAVTEGSEVGGNYIAADANASGGHFVGDLSGYSWIEFDLYLDEDAYAPSLELSLFDLSTTEWHYGLTRPSVGWNHYFVPLSGGAGWYNYNSGPLSWSQLIQNVGETSIFLTYGKNATSGLVDNFAIMVPEPGSLVLGALALAGGLFWRRRRGR